MIFSPEEEVMIFLVSVITGAAIPILYDLFSVCVKKNHCHIFVCHVLDVIAVTATCIILFYMTLSVSRGIVRFFEFCGLVLGVVLYKLLFSKLFCTVFSHLTDFLCRFFKNFFKILLTPIEFMYKIFIKCINGLLYPFVWIAKKWHGICFARCKRAFRLFREIRNKM